MSLTQIFCDNNYPKLNVHLVVGEVIGYNDLALEEKERMAEDLCSKFVGAWVEEDEIIRFRARFEEPGVKNKLLLATSPIRHCLKRIDGVCSFRGNSSAVTKEVFGNIFSVFARNEFEVVSPTFEDKDDANSFFSFEFWIYNAELTLGITKTGDLRYLPERFRRILYPVPIDCRIGY